MRERIKITVVKRGPRALPAPASADAARSLTQPGGAVSPPPLTAVTRHELVIARLTIAGVTQWSLYEPARGLIWLRAHSRTHLLQAWAKLAAEFPLPAGFDPARDVHVQRRPVQ